MHIEKKEVKPGIHVLGMDGSIHTGPECQQISKAVDELVQLNQTKVIFDLSRVTHIDSAAVGTIVLSFSKLKKAGGGLKLVVVTGMVEKVLKLTQVHRAIPLFSTTDEAASNFTP